MKKQILTLAICLAMTASTTLTTSAKTVATKTPTKPAACTTKKITKASTKATVTATNKTPEVTLTPEQLAKKKFQAKLAKDRDELYCTLGLTPAQKAKAAVLNQQQDAKAEPLITKVCTEKAKLSELKSKNASNDEIGQQKKEVKKAKKALKANFKSAQKDFEALLTKDQLAKFTALKEEHKKRHCKCKRHKHECNKPEDNNSKDTAPVK